MSRCIGFGEREGKCENPAGTKWGPLWCEECDTQRLTHIDAQMQRISERFEALVVPVEKQP